MDNHIENRQIRIFISSTFIDMEKERNYLIDKIFPVLREQAIQRDVALSALDLRWGIPQKLAASGKTIEICMEEIDNSHPFFIGLVGNRYGWCPSIQNFNDNDNLKNKYPMLEDYFKQGLSVTEMEMRYAALDRDEKELEQHKIDASFYLKKNPAPIKKGNKDKAKLKQLKKRIKNKKNYFAVYEYASLEEIGELVRKDFEALLDRYFPINNNLSPLERERNRQKAYRNNLCRFYIENENNFKALDSFLQSDAHKKVLIGNSGIGKSALIARWLQRKESIENKWTFFYHFIGNGETECDYQRLVTRLIDEVKDIFHFTLDTGETVEERHMALEKRLERVLGHIPQDQHLIIVIDGLNQLFNKDDAKTMKWIPGPMQNVKYLFSTLEKDATYTALIGRGFETMTLQPLDATQRKEFVIKYLKSFSKQLDNDEQINAIVSNPKNSNTLVLRTLLDELIYVGQYDKMDEIIAFYLKSNSIKDFFQQVLQRISSGEEDKWVENALSLIAVSKNGLSEDEIINITQTHQLYWSRFYCAFKNHFVIRNGLITFMHQYMREAVTERFLTDESIVINYRQQIINYYNGKNSNRAIEELSYQYFKNEAFDNLHQVISSPMAFDYLYDHDQNQLIQYWMTLNNKDRVRYDLRKIITLPPDPNNKNAEWTWIQYRFRLLHFFELMGRGDLMEESTKIIKDLGLSRPMWAEVWEKEGYYFQQTGQIDKALEHIRRAYDTWEELFPYDSTQKKTSLLLHMGKLYQESNLPDKAIKVLKSALAQAKELRDDYQIGMGYLYLASAFCQIGDYEQERECHKLALQFSKALEGTSTIDGAITMTNIAIVESRNGQYEAAHQHFHQALRVLRGIYGDTGEPIAQLYDSIGTCYNSRGIFHIAIQCKLKSLKMFREAGTTENNITNIWKDLGVIYQNKGDYYSSTKYCLKALRGFSHSGNYTEIANTYRLIALNFYNEESYDKALKAIHKGLEIANQHKNTAHFLSVMTYTYGICLYGVCEFQKAFQYLCEALDILITHDACSAEAIDCIKEVMNSCFQEEPKLFSKVSHSIPSAHLTTHQKMASMQDIDITLEQKIRLVTWSKSVDPFTWHILLNNLYTPIDQCLDNFLKENDKNALFITILMRWEKLIGKDILRHILPPILFSYDGLTEKQIINIGGISKQQWRRIFSICKDIFELKNQKIMITNCMWKESILNEFFNGNISNLADFITMTLDLCQRNQFLWWGNAHKYYMVLKQDMNRILQLEHETQTSIISNLKENYYRLVQISEEYYALLCKYFPPQHDFNIQLLASIAIGKFVLSQSEEAIKYAQEAFLCPHFGLVVEEKQRGYIHKILGDSALKEKKHEIAWMHLYNQYQLIYELMDDKSKKQLISDLHTCKSLASIEFLVNNARQIEAIMPMFREVFGKFA